MRGINAEARSNAHFFLLMFFGCTLLALAVGVIAAVRPAALDPAGLTPADAAGCRQAYLGPWTAWNHVRTVAAAARASHDPGRAALPLRILCETAAEGQPDDEGRDERQ
jgi:hypothetical protein